MSVNPGFAGQKFMPEVLEKVKFFRSKIESENLNIDIEIDGGIDFETALGTIYGIDIMQDNVNLCRNRLLCGRQDLNQIVVNNIICANGLEKNFVFGNKCFDLS